MRFIRRGPRHASEYAEPTGSLKPALSARRCERSTCRVGVMDLPLLSALFVAFALTLYVLLDGFDLGVGALLLFQPDETQRDHMVDSITPTWDGNETWLIMAGVGPLAGFPIAYGRLLPARYLPLLAMLLSLGVRGVSFEFRNIVPFQLSLWDAASATLSHVFMLVGAAVVTPIVLAYSAFACHVFRGKSPEQGWES
jgi:cytochrome bd ubiquinol oxidase subunit II